MMFALHTSLFFRRKLLETLRQPVWIVTGLSTPLLYLALFEPLLRSVAGGAGLPALVVIAIAVGFGFNAHWGGLVLLLLLLAVLTAACSATSSALGMNLKQIGSLAAVVTGVQLPLTLLSGILLPLSLGPAWLRVLGHLNPMYYAVEAARDLAAGTITTAAVGVGFLVMAAVAALSVWWGTRSYQQAMV
jgi:ABC-2 type transport system permease protein